jgi:D-alanyl-D-alanine carboxypeptidase/D-alanyl-D-alanine-endopeptidase (penicillin-binding protein 4)
MVNQTSDHLIYRHISPFPVEQIVAKLLEFSNNFTTNQLLIACGARVLGPPGTLQKGVSTALTYAAEKLQIRKMEIFEGSGIYRKNKVSAMQMKRILEAFFPHVHLMRHEGREFFKTGTLHGINTRAGFIEGRLGEFYPYVVMLNTPGKTTRPVMRKIMQYLD